MINIHVKQAKQNQSNKNIIHVLSILQLQQVCGLKMDFKIWYLCDCRSYNAMKSEQNGRYFADHISN